jgi:hypothetical protein
MYHLYGPVQLKPRTSGSRHSSPSSAHARTASEGMCDNDMPPDPIDASQMRCTSSQESLEEVFLVPLPCMVAEDYRHEVLAAPKKLRASMSLLAQTPNHLSSRLQVVDIVTIPLRATAHKSLSKTAPIPVAATCVSSAEVPSLSAAAATVLRTPEIVAPTGRDHEPKIPLQSVKRDDFRFEPLLHLTSRNTDSTP